MAFDWKKLKFWEKQPKKEANPYMAAYNQPKKKEPEKKEGGNAVRKVALAAVFSTVAAGGGAWYYNYATEKNVTFTVNSIERIYDVTCHSRVSESKQDITSRAENGQPRTERRDVARELEAQRCERVPVAYILHTDQGDFVNNASLLRGKFQDSADRLQTTFEEGQLYSARVYGMNFDVPGSPNDIRQNVISAERLVIYDPYTGSYGYGGYTPPRNNPWNSGPF